MIIIGPMNMAVLDLNLLRVLDALLREGSTVAAGRRVGLSQSAVSAALGRLRHALGDPLFVRRGPKLEPTPYALSLVGPLREHLDGLERLLQGPERFDPATAEATFRLSGVDFFAEMLMPALGRLLRRVAPGIRVHLLDLAPRAYAEMLDREVVDVALLPQRDCPDWVDLRPLFRVDFVMIARVGHPRLAEAGVALGGAVPLDLFCELDHLLVSPDGKPRAAMDDALEKVGRSRRVVMTLPFMGSVCRCVAGDDVVAMVPRQFAERVAGEMGLALYELPIPMAAPIICMAWHKRTTTSPPHRWLRETVADLLCPLNGSEGVPPA
jgi:DNA-binding transcriptional LysR family regulator